ncbi:MAG: hypothetical protein JO212_09060 [Acetobacteraceae bacterium]|nr:hypothetical protein [Deltaproteobacteria bacterium]MBV8590193.1 hypothetical protein [Acetobacteraceae bacterium]
MKQWTWLKVAAVLQALGTILHTIATASGTASGSSTPGAREQALLEAMRSFHFDIMGSSRSVWDFYRGYEFSMTVVFAVLAVLMWLLSSLSRTNPRQALPLIVTVLVCIILLDILSWTYFFAGPGVMSALISLCMASAVASSYRDSHVMLPNAAQTSAS